MGTIKGNSADMNGHRNYSLRGWLGLAAGLGLLWVTAYVILPWGNQLPYIQPIMQAIEDSEIDAGTYWYTQSEETAVATMFVQNTLRTQ
ncbi:hypothetical protein [Desulfatitalea alkaliphila]|uniref:Uncharacterized protein n=1 Tax=Desulfatitalea alkaliphila TaxID=2929485 RepID=A0AA41QXX0_9BACT|nr:hypothetical protein [Desulfatitalea alkaliphila]MCJ8498962.1 hypothetical protein [Desulfatitalea alkaliphila]